MVDAGVKRTDGDKTVSKKLVAIILVATLLGATGFYVWREYYRHWSIEDLDEAVILVDEWGPIINGFKTHLAGRTVTVEADIGHIRTIQTSLGELNILRLEGARYVGLMQWGSADYEVGDRIVMDVSFEWAAINGIEGVFSPQATLGLGVLAEVQIVLQAISWVRAEWVIGVDDLGDDVTVRVDKANEPVPLGISNCSIKAGANLGIMEYIDLLGFYGDQPLLDKISSLEESNGENGTITFLDVNEDGYLDDGDTFTLTNLTRPTTDLGAQTYLLWVERELFPEEPDRYDNPGMFFVYLIMTRNGVFWTTSGEMPIATSHLTPVDNGVSVSVEYVSRPVRWNDIELAFHDGTQFARWTPNETMLGSGPDASFNCGTEDLGDLSWECSVIDVEGDGCIGVGDMIELMPSSNASLEDGDTFTAMVIFRPIGEQILSESFHFGMEPTSECSVTIEDEILEATFAPVHNGTGRDYMLMDVMWSEVVVTVDDGTNTTDWQPDPSALDVGEPASWTDSDAILGTLILECSAFDLQGNGLVNSGDMVRIAVTSDDGFSPGAEYTVCIRYLPTNTDLFSITFDG